MKRVCVTDAIMLGRISGNWWESIGVLFIL